MHERVLMDDVVRRLESVAAEEGAQRVIRVRVRLGALSHFTPQHFREHFEDATRGTVAEGAEVEAQLATDTSDPAAQGVVVESVDVQLAR